MDDRLKKLLPSVEDLEKRLSSHGNDALQIVPRPRIELGTKL